MEAFFWYTNLIFLGMLLSIPYFFMGDISHRKKHLIIFLILILTTVVEILGKYMAVTKQNNSWIYNIGYVIFGLSLIFYFFSLVFQEKKEKRVVFFLWVSFIGWEVTNVLFYQSIFYVFHHYSLAYGSFLIIGLCFYFFHGIFFKNWYLEKNLIEVPEFWVISFLMFFHSASLLYFISFSFYLEYMDRALFLQLSFLNKILGVSLYIVMGLAFYAPLVFRKSNV
jgi:hypothetical protein